MFAIDIAIDGAVVGKVIFVNDWQFVKVEAIVVIDEPSIGNTTVFNE